MLLLPYFFLFSLRMNISQHKWRETLFKVHLKSVFNGADTWLEGGGGGGRIYAPERRSLRPRVRPDSSLPDTAVLTRVL